MKSISSLLSGTCQSLLANLNPREKREEPKKGLDALYNEIDENGTVQHVSYGTNVGHDLDHYRNIPIRPMQYGQGLAMIAIIEGYEALKEEKR